MSWLEAILAEAEESTTIKESSYSKIIQVRVFMMID